MILFASSIFASAFLLFMVQPMVGKQILPWFGGGPGVWSLCLAFYQTTLFLGYAYAHLLVEYVDEWRQPLVHALLLVLALFVLPVLPDASWQPTPNADPSARILLMLLANVGLPFFLLAATGPLLQAWFTRVKPGRSPYPLYAASNLGSLLALIGYPLLVEPNLPLPQSSQAWSWAFAMCGLAILVCAWQGTRGAGRGRAARSQMGAGMADSIEPRDVALWTGLASVAVVLLLGITNELCLDVASVPFLWALPLCVYLSTLILCFGDSRVYRRGAFAPVAAIATLILVSFWLESDQVGWGTWEYASTLPKIVAYLAVLFSCCMLAHGELYRLRPEPTRLTAYYLCLSGGGALGGLFVGLVAPRIFSEYYELPIGLVSCWLLFAVACWRDRQSALHVSRHRKIWQGVAGMVLGVLLLLAGAATRRAPGILLQQRNFFGVLTVSQTHGENPQRTQRELSSGTTLHGAQLVHPAPRQPTAYYGIHTGIGFVMQNRSPDKATRVGVVGLGVGTLAAYGRQGDHFRFYEIDPDVIRIAGPEGYFSFLEDSRATIQIVPGDARLSLDAELRQGLEADFDILALDAFSSDSIPMHLLTVEAFEIYDRRCAPGCTLALHLSNDQLDLIPLAFGLAAKLRFHAVAIVNEDRELPFRSTWVVLSREAEPIHSLADLVCARSGAAASVEFPRPDLTSETPLWTDDHSDLLRVVIGFGAARDGASLVGNGCAGRRVRSGR